MAIRSRATLKTFFETGDFPTQEQFADLIDSLRHVGDAVPMEEVTGLLTVLNQLNASIAALTTVPPITGSADVDVNMAFADVGVLREAVFVSAVATTFTIRKNADPATDFEVEIVANVPYLHLLSMPVYAGATLEFLNPTALFNYTIYRA
jgi:hypothetical protein